MNPLGTPPATQIHDEFDDELSLRSGSNSPVQETGDVAMSVTSSAAGTDNVIQVDNDEDPIAQFDFYKKTIENFETKSIVHMKEQKVRWNHGEAEHNGYPEYTNLSLYVPTDATNEVTGKPLIVYFTTSGSKSFFSYVTNENSKWDQTKYLLQNAYILSVDLGNTSKNYDKTRALKGCNRDNFIRLL